MSELSGSQRLKGFGRSSLLNVGSEGLGMLLGLAIAAYLTRVLGTQDYGLVALAFTIVTFVDWLVGSPMPKAALKLISEAQDVDAAARTVNRAHVWIGVAGSGLVVLGAEPLAAGLGRPELAPVLMVLAAEPLLTLTTLGLRRIFHGRGRFRLVAAATLIRWAVRAVLVVLLVGVARLSVLGAVLALVGAVGVELVVLALLRPFPMAGMAAPMRDLAVLGAPLSVAFLASRLHGSVDIILVQALDGDPVTVGLYGAARHAFLVPAMLGGAVAPLLLSTLGRLRREGREEREAARILARTVLRLPFAGLPLAAAGAGAATELAGLAFGQDFAPAGDMMAVLLVGGMGALLFGLLGVIFTVEGRLRALAVLALPLPVLSVVAMVLAIPRYGAMAGAWATTGSVLLVAGACAVSVQALSPGVVPVASLLRGLALSPVAYLLGAIPTPGALGGAPGGGGGGGGGAGLGLLGEHAVIEADWSAADTGGRGPTPGPMDPDLSPVSVVVPSYNSRRHIRSCLRSLQAQATEADVEIIVVDSSDDGTDRVVETEFPDARLIHVEPRRSAGAARNLGLAEARGNIILFTDADCVVSPTWIDDMRRALSRTGADAICGAIGDGTSWNAFGRVGFFLEFFRFLASSGPPRDVSLLVTANAGFRRSALEANRFVDGSVAEDFILSWQLAQGGKTLRFVPSVVVAHSNRTRPAEVWRHQHVLGMGASRYRRLTSPRLVRVLERAPVLAFALPFVTVPRIALVLARHQGPLAFLEYLLLSPLALLFNLSWAAGLRRGLLEGPDPTEAHPG